MSDGTPDRETLDTAQNLTKGMKVLAEEVKRLRTYGHHNRWFVLIDIGLTILLTVFGYLSVNAASQARSAGLAAAANHTNLVASCEAGNQTRAEEVMLWDHLAQISRPAPGSTKAQVARDKAEIATLLAYIRKTFAKRQCTKLYATSGPGK